jgi:predicted phosphoribosyltransferase
MIFNNRKDAGKQLSEKLAQFKGSKTIVLALPRGGVPVGYEVANRLNLPLEIIVSRKIGAPLNPELGIGAISENNSMVIDQNTVELLNITQKQIQEIINEQKKELERRIKLYRNGRSLPNLSDKSVILVDDGLATGVTAQAAVIALKKQNPKNIIFAAPVCARKSANQLKHAVDKIACVFSPHDLQAIGAYYRNFDQLTDEKVIKLLRN